MNGKEIRRIRIKMKRIDQTLKKSVFKNVLSIRKERRAKAVRSG
ncbi:MAG: hypothetical protein RRZ24_09960 [Clostridia bacterium]